MTILDKLREEKANKNDKELKVIKIGNNFIESFIKNSNAITLKIVFYIASKSNKIQEGDMITSLQIDMKNLCNFCNIDIRTLRGNIDKLQKTIIYLLDTDEEIEKIVLLPRTYEQVGKGILEIDIYNKLLKLIKDVERNYTTIDLYNLMKLQNKHSIRMIQLLEHIQGFSKEVAKRKYYELDELNAMFGTNYKNCYEFERKILKPVKDELDEVSKLSFIYTTKNIETKRGRPKSIGFIFDLLDNKVRQLTMFR